ncbi:glycosyltransferase family 4 protein [Bosea sp. UNC402CLCol]|uniref:glycosyltransferase family 4 protein n=1 Tax=Bosea sp. UNC402CLCol TaxID=1510531 RepID=UPI00056F26CD|nr:glycosyltransferase family 4 protein [Bosea sp. UNC402CLCol]
MPRPKLLFVATEDWFFASHFLPMARAAREMGLDVAVVARERNHRRVIEAAGARLIALEAERRSLDPRALFRQVTALKRIIAAEKPDILHCIALKPIALAGLAGKLAGIERRVYALTGLGFLGAKQGLLAALARFAAVSWLRGAIDGRQVRFLFENPDDPVTLGLDPQDAAKVAIVGGAGVDPLILMPSPMLATPPFKVAIVARMLWSKGVDLAVEAIRLARAEGVKVTLTIHGAPDPSNPKAIPEATLKEWTARPGIVWAGPTRDIEGVWKAHHLCIMPSRGGEGLPRTILEAAACGRPILTTDVPGCRSFVREGRDGMVVPPDDAAALAKALLVFARAPGVAERMGANARARLLDGHTERDVMNAVKALYRGLLAQPTTDVAA